MQCVGPTHAGHFGLRAYVVHTEARNGNGQDAFGELDRRSEDAAGDRRRGLPAGYLPPNLPDNSVEVIIAITPRQGTRLRGSLRGGDFEKVK